MDLFLLFHPCELEANRSHMRSVDVLKWITGEHPAEPLRWLLLPGRIISSKLDSEVFPQAGDKLRAPRSGGDLW